MAKVNTVNTPAIYYIVSTTGHGGYIGQADKLYRRIYQHYTDAYRKNTENSPIHDMIARCGLYKCKIVVYGAEENYGLPRQIIDEFKEMYVDSNGKELKDIDVAEILHILYWHEKDKSVIRHNLSMGGQNNGLAYKIAPNIKIALKSYTPDTAAKIFTTNPGFVQALEIAAGELYKNIFRDDWKTFAEEFQDKYSPNKRLWASSGDHTFSEVMEKIVNIICNHSYKRIISEGKFRDDVKNIIGKIIDSDFISPKEEIMSKMFRVFAKQYADDFKFSQADFDVENITNYLIATIKNKVVTALKGMHGKDIIIKDKFFKDNKMIDFTPSKTNWSVVWKFRNRPLEVPKWYQDLMNCNLSLNEYERSIEWAKHCSFLTFAYIIRKQKGSFNGQDILTRYNTQYGDDKRLFVNVSTLYDDWFGHEVYNYYLNYNIEFVQTIPWMQMYRPMMTLLRKDLHLPQFEERSVEGKYAVGYEADVGGEEVFFYWRSKNIMLSATAQNMIYY